MKTIKDFKNRIINGDSLKVMKSMPEKKSRFGCY